ncbi:MAG: DUF2807 domain-containing protein [Cytophagales bacterium]|nr:DUF2807 domain-containing protein [Cytophagales bacterium]
MKSSGKLFTTHIAVAIIIFASVSVFAQNKVVREIAPFDKVKISDDLKVTFKKADKENITIVANGIGYDKIVTASSGRTLKMKVKTGIFKSTDVQILVEYVKLRSIEASNKADVKFEERLTGDELSLKATGGAVIRVEVDVSALKASLSNGGRIEISGKADLQEVEASLGAKFNAYEFETENGYVKSNTNSDVVVWVKNRLEATAGSKAELKYRGKPVDVKSNTSLGGKISGDL